MRRVTNKNLKGISACSVSAPLVLRRGTFGPRWEDLSYVTFPPLLSLHNLQNAHHTQVIALYNGGPAGVIYEFIAVACCYFMIAACIAEMASAIPSSAGVYHWASVTAGARFGKVIGFYAGWYASKTPTSK
jgi:hypothetical protein